MAANMLVIGLGVLALAGLGLGMATLAQNPYGGMHSGGCAANGGGCPAFDGSGSTGAQGAACHQSGGGADATCPALQNGTCPYQDGTSGS